MKLAMIILALAGTLAAAQDAQDSALKLQSDQKLGFVSLNSDLVLNDGRLILTIGVFNKSTIPAQFAPEQVTVTTAAGKPVPLASLAQLEDETRVALGAKPVHRPDDYSQVSAMQRPMDVSASGERDVSGYTGGDGLSTSVSKKPVKKGEAANSEKLEAALQNLRAGILQGITVEPRGAAGGQVVTQAIKFGRGEPRKLKVAVNFAAEKHEFEFEVPKPPARGQ